MMFEGPTEALAVAANQELMLIVQPEVNQLGFKLPKPGTVYRVGFRQGRVYWGGVDISLLRGGWWAVVPVDFWANYSPTQQQEFFEAALGRAKQGGGNVTS